MNVKYPDVTVKLTGTDGNAFAIIGRCSAAARKAKVPADDIKAFQAEAMSGDYDNLLQTAMKWFEIH